MRVLIENRGSICLALAAVLGTVLYMRFPFPSENTVLQLTAAQKPLILQGIKSAGALQAELVVQ